MSKLIESVKRILGLHIHEWTDPITVSGYGYTEYEIRFCKSSKCLKCEGKLTKQLW